MQGLTCNLGKIFLFHGKRCLVKILNVKVLEYVAVWYVTEQGNFVF